MDYDKLLDDASGLAPAASKRQKYMALASKLTAELEDPVDWKRVKKWFERQSIPGEWLAQIMTLKGRRLSIADYVL